MISFLKDTLQVQVYPARTAMGEAAAAQAAAVMTRLLAEQPMVNIIFAAAPSQQEFLEALVLQPGIDWSRVNAFHMDEYAGLPADAPQGFGNFLRERIFSKVPFRDVFYLDGQASDKDAECLRYTALLEQYLTDIVYMGIGENAHIAFNDPHVADFNDPALVKIVDLDQACRQQQVNDGCFTVLNEVPQWALTLTVTALMRGRYIFCMVPGEKKATAVRHTLEDAIQEKYPSSILRTHPSAILYLDNDSAQQIDLSSFHIKPSIQ
ncbi:glucosamine-6-phosphate deaminase [Chitinophaga qingshengii]|uniref:Glucosamine-6-phosphate deaminase n=1 Tax=Chitinophaga qingshengii TaxID=1569794 RepID=A0ABR7TGC7_9BACT|nr:glucosamine-6-phosphate deaminase [Chitinophaga qingshengii]MBC9929496.1 glucosamine-6-phosphate deaminase [Chitinophaga qingshengii]